MNVILLTVTFWLDVLSIRYPDVASRSGFIIMVAVINRRDPRWNNDAWRTKTFADLMDEFDLSYQEVAEMTEREINTVRHWRSGKIRAIPKSLLRLLVLEFALDGIDALS